MYNFAKINYGFPLKLIFCTRLIELFLQNGADHGSRRQFLWNKYLARQDHRTKTNARMLKKFNQETFFAPGNTMCFAFSAPKFAHLSSASLHLQLQAPRNLPFLCFHLYIFPNFGLIFHIFSNFGSKRGHLSPPPPSSSEQQRAAPLSEKSAGQSVRH